MSDEAKKRRNNTEKWLSIEFSNIIYTLKCQTDGVSCERVTNEGSQKASIFHCAIDVCQLTENDKFGVFSESKLRVWNCLHHFTHAHIYYAEKSIRYAREYFFDGVFNNQKCKKNVRPIPKRVSLLVTTPHKLLLVFDQI